MCMSFHGSISSPALNAKQVKIESLLSQILITLGFFSYIFNSCDSSFEMFIPVHCYFCFVVINAVIRLCSAR